MSTPTPRGTRPSASASTSTAATPTLDEDQIDALFEPELAAAIEGGRRLVPHFDALSAARQHVCVDLTFNLGAAGFGNSRKTLDAIDVGDHEAAAQEQEDRPVVASPGRGVDLSGA